MKKNLPIIGVPQEECWWCGRDFSCGKSHCPHCGQDNPDYVPRDQRFAPKKSHLQRERLVYIDGILTKLEEEA